ncbi:MAG: hypothetical protein ACUVSP_09620, partial [Desulfotomaculales bacterium]
VPGKTWLEASDFSQGRFTPALRRARPRDLKREYAEMALERCGFGKGIIDSHTYEVIDHVGGAPTVPGTVTG